MKTRLSLSLSLAAFALLVAPASALTLEQAQAELAGMYCSGSSCSSSTTETSTRELPGTSVSEGVGSTNTDGLSRTCFTADISGRPFKNGEQCFVPTSLSPTTGGYSIPGGFATSADCVTTTKTLSYNGPNTSRDTAWSVSSSESSSSGAC